MSKVSPDTKDAIRDACANGESQRVVAEKYGISQGYVSNIAVTWPPPQPATPCSPPTSGRAPGGPTRHGCTICGDPDCLGDVDLSLVANGVPEGKTPRRARQQSASILRGLTA